jgi:hypothetical protein
MFLNIIKPLIASDDTNRYDSYKLLVFKVVDNTVDGDLSANTGLSYDKTRRLIYSAVTPLNSISTGIHVFNEDGVFQSQLPLFSIQGFDYDPILDQFIVWSQGGASATLKTFAYDGTELYSQSSFDPFGDGSSSGSVCYDYLDDLLLFTTGGTIPLRVLERSGSDWVYKENVGSIADATEGIAFDENTNTYWYNRLTDIVNVEKDGTLIRTIPQTTETSDQNEGLAINPIKETLYINSDKGFHGGEIDGNRCVEVYPNYTE